MDWMRKLIQLAHAQKIAAPQTDESTHARERDSWSPEEEQQLRAEFACGQSISHLAASHQRRVSAIRRRMRRLGLQR